MKVLIAPIGIAIAILVLTWAWRGLNWIWLRPLKLERLLRQQGLSGNSYRLVFGDMIDISRMKNEARSKPMDFSNDILPRVDPFLHHTIQHHGKKSFVWFGPIPVVIIFEPELMREVLVKINSFPKPNFSLGDLLAPGIASYNGQKWSKHRKLINPSFHIDKLKLMLSGMYTSCNELIIKWEKMASKSGCIEMDVCADIVSLTADVISRVAFGSSYVQGRQVFQLIDEQSRAVFSNMELSFIPGWRYIPTKANRRFHKVHEDIRSIIRGLIEKRRKEMEEGETKNDDILGTLLESNLKEMQQNGDKEMTTEELINECKLFYLAGQDTTSGLLTFTMIMLGRYTDWQARAREEILTTFGKSKPDFDGLNRLKIVTMILYEVLRLYPPIPMLWRKVDRNTRLGNMSLPDGVFLTLPVICSHHEPQYWGEDATEFKPERFAQGIAKVTNGNSIFFPFSSGPRICIGQNFALIEAKMALAMILQNFSFELSPSYLHAPSPIITIRPQFGAQLILHQL